MKVQRNGLAVVWYRAIEAADAILLNYGWARNWENPSLYNDARAGTGQNDGSPGIGIDVARWLGDAGCLNAAPAVDPLR